MKFVHPSFIIVIVIYIDKYTYVVYKGKYITNDINFQLKIHLRLKSDLNNGNLLRYFLLPYITVIRNTIL